MSSNVPPKSKIAQYWASRNESAGWVIDWGEPTCWACGMPSGNCVTDPNATGDELFKVWNTANKLQICHINPKSLGGADECKNLVLLCCQCHDDSPDVPDERVMIKWIELRDNYIARRFKSFGSELVKFGVQPESLTDKDLGALKSNIGCLGLHASQVYGGTAISASSFAGLIYQARINNTMEGE